MFLRRFFLIVLALFHESMLRLTRADEFAFFDACIEGDAVVITSLLSSKAIADVNFPDENGATPLILAARNGRVEATAALLDGGADIELPGN